MPHLEEQFPPVNPLLLQRPDALDPPDREEEETGPARNRTEDEIPLPGSLADGIDRVTLSANARVIVPVQPNGETTPLPADLVPGAIEVNPVVPELLDIETRDRDVGGGAPEVDEIIGASLKNFLNVLETRRRVEASSIRTDLNPIEPRSVPTGTPPTAPESTPATPLVQNAARETREETASRTENRVASEPTPATPPVQNAEREPREASAPGIENRIVAEPLPAPIAALEAPSVTEAELEQDEAAVPRNENRFVPVAPPPRGPLSVEPNDVVVPEPADDALNENTLGIRGNIPTPRTEGRVNILTIPAVGQEPPGINIQETRNLGQGRALSLDLATSGNDDTFITVDTIDEALEEAGAIAGPDAPEPQAVILLPASALTGVNAAPIIAESTADPQNTDFNPALPDPSNFNAQRDPADIPGPEGRTVETSFLVDTRQVFEEDQEAQALQSSAFPELDPDEPFVPILEPEAPARNIPFVVQGPLNVLPPSVENVVAVAPAVPGSVAALDENSQALRHDNLGTDPALRANRELRNFLQEFNAQIEPPEEVTEDDGPPVTEVQNNAPPPPPVFENLEAESAELLDRVRERQATQGVTRPEEERTAPPEPRTPESVLTGRGQNIDRFI